MIKFKTFALGALMVCAATAAQAHAQLDHAVPAVGSTVASSPGQVTLYFTESLEPKFSGGEVTNASGARVDHGASVSGKVMRLSVGALPAGKLQREMARALGRYAQDTRKLWLPGRTLTRRSPEPSGSGFAPHTGG